MNRLLVLVFFVLSTPFAWGQLQFGERLEIPVKGYEPTFELMRVPTGMLAFRSFQPRSLVADRVLEYFTFDSLLNASELAQVKIRDGFDLIGYDGSEELTYFLFAKGTTAAAEKYILKLDLRTREGLEFPASNLVPMDLIEFLVQEERALFLGYADARPVLQVLSLVDKSVFTVQGIYGNDTKVLQLIKLPQEEAMEVVLKRKGPFKMWETILLTFDLEGNLLQEVKLDDLAKDDKDLMNGVLLNQEGYQTLIGAFGKEIRNSYEGMAVTKINPFGETETESYTLEDFSNFYAYLPEKRREKQEAYLVGQREKGKIPTLRNAYAVRKVWELENSYLIYFDQFSVTSTRGPGRVPPPQGSSYRYDRGVRMGYNPLFMDPYNGIYGSMPMYTVITEYTYRSAHFISLAKSGEVLWDNAVSYQDLNTTFPEPFGEFSVVGDEVFHLYLENDQIKLSYLKGAETVVANQSFFLELDPSQGKINYTDLGTLRLSHWYGPYYLLAGLQKVSRKDENGQDLLREVFFIQKILVDGDLYVPNEDAD